MIWMALGAASVVWGAPYAAESKDSAALAELRNRLPNDIRAKVEKAHWDQKLRHDTLARLTPAERNQWLDSLRREATSRRSEVLQNLAPNERERMEFRLRELERQNLQRPRTDNPSNPNRPHQEDRQIPPVPPVFP